MLGETSLAVLLPEEEKKSIRIHVRSEYGLWSALLSALTSQMSSGQKADVSGYTTLSSNPIKDLYKND